MNKNFTGASFSADGSDLVSPLDNVNHTGYVVLWDELTRTNANAPKLWDSAAEQATFQL